VAKLLGELDCITFAHLYGLEAVCLRFAHVYGPGRSISSPYAETVGLVLRALHTGQQLVLCGDGHRPRDILFIDDAIRAILLAAESERPRGRVYNIGSGCAKTTLDVVHSVNALLGTRLELLLTAPHLPTEIDNLLDGTRAREELGFVPQVDLLDGLTQWLEHQHQEVPGHTVP
jgi:UDP-glucose 4-epimerase